MKSLPGLMKRMEPDARPGTCRASSCGTTRRPLLWVVQCKDVWLRCQYPGVGSQCEPMFARTPANLPHDAVQ